MPLDAPKKLRGDLKTPLDANECATLLRATPQLSKAALGDFLSGPEPFPAAVLAAGCLAARRHICSASCGCYRSAFHAAGVVAALREPLLRNSAGRKFGGVERESREGLKEFVENCDKLLGTSKF